MSTSAPKPNAALRLYTGPGFTLCPGQVADLPDDAARHAQVRRVQPGDHLRLFDGQGCDWPAQVQSMTRSTVRVQVGEPEVVDLELRTAVTLALVVPANERMDSLVEKASELGVAHIQPLMAERSVLRLAGERADRRQAHWQGVAIAACEQCGRARVPTVAAVQPLLPWLAAGAPNAGPRWLLSLRADARPLPALLVPGAMALTTLSGPEGGLTPAEEEAALAAGFVPASLGPRVLRADTAPLAVLAWLALQGVVTP